jgi:hypothetical protein
MPNHLDRSIITKLEKEIKSFVKEKFLTHVKECELNINSSENLNDDIISFFKEIYGKNKNITFISTNYDFIIEKIFNNIDENICLNRGAIDHSKFKDNKWKNSPVSLYKINGGFDVCYKNEDSYFISHDHENSPSIIIPSKDQDYGNKYFKNVFLKSANKLREARSLVFIGYSIPDEDVIIKFLLKNFVDISNQEKEIIIIDRNHESAENIKRKVTEIFPSLKHSDAIKIYTKSFNDLVSK